MTQQELYKQRDQVMSLGTNDCVRGGKLGVSELSVRRFCGRSSAPSSRTSREKIQTQLKRLFPDE